jgi:NAD(P)-dependent dehydrogenase (short-subunit alcohol dehydrogenase family)
MPDLVRLLGQLLSPDAPAKIARRWRASVVARSVIRANPLFTAFSRQFRFRRLRYGVGQTVMVFGAGGEIGQAVASQLLLRGCHVIGTYWNRRPQLPSHEGLQLFQIDITSVDQVSDLYLALEQQGVCLDLILVATGFNSRLNYHASTHPAELSRKSLSQELDDILRSFQVNALGPYLLIRRFAALIDLASDRPSVPQICLLSSSLGTMNNELYGGSYGYRTGKGALHALAMAMYCDLNIDARIGMQILGPGNVDTRMNPGGLMSPEEAASEIIENIEFNRKRPCFQFLAPKGRRISW